MILSDQYKFKCKFCEMDFGDNVIELAIHIGRVHDDSKTNHIL